MNRKGPWEGYRRQAKPVVSFAPSFARTFSSRERRLGTRQEFKHFIFQAWKFMKFYSRSLKVMANESLFDRLVSADDRAKTM